MSAWLRQRWGSPWVTHETGRSCGLSGSRDGPAAGDMAGSDADGAAATSGLVILAGVVNGSEVRESGDGWQATSRG